MKKTTYMPMGTKQALKTKMIRRNSVDRLRSENMTGNAYNIALLMCVVALRDEFDFGTQRLERFIERVKSMTDSYSEHHASLSDYNNMIYEETGIQICDPTRLAELDKNYSYEIEDKKC